MKTLDIFKTKTSQKLNETLEKTFGKKLKLETFSIEQLHDVRNKLRTQIHQFKQSSSFNETVENETYTKAQWMLDTVNAAIAERGEFTSDPQPAEIDEGFGSLEEKVAEIIKKFDEDMMEIGGYGDPDQAKIVELLRQGDVEGATEVVWYAYADQDGGELRDMDNYIEDIEDQFADLAQGGDEDEGGETDDSYALASAGHGSDEDYGDFGRDESFDTETNEAYINSAKDAINILADLRKQSKMAERGQGDPVRPNQLVNDLWDVITWIEANMKESFKTNEDTQGEDMRKVTEGEIQQAQSIVTAKTMVDRVGRWIEELSGMENDTLLTLGDQIRDEMGQEQAKAFLSACAPAIQQALENLKQTRETLATGVRTLTGEQQPAEIIGADPAAAPADDVAGPAEPDAMNAEPDLDVEGGDLGDEFGASEPATGGAEETGRAKRESINYSNKLLKVLAG
jgi:hypothetical protein